MELFRKQVINHKLTPRFGSVQIDANVSTNRLFYIFLLFFCLAISFLFIGSYNDKQNVRGVIESDRGIVSLSAPKSGVVEQIFVHEGQKVETGDVLFKISLQTNSTPKIDVNEQQLEQLKAQKKIIEDLLTSKAEAFKTVKHKHSLTKQSLIKQIEVLSRDSHLLNSEYALIKTQEENKRKLVSSSLIPKSELSLAQQKVLIAELKRSSQEYSLLKAKLHLETLESDLAISGAQHLDIISELNLKRIDLDKQLSKQTITQALYVKSHSNGLVSGLNVKQGKLVNVGDYLVSIAPIKTLYTAKLFIPSSAIGQVSLKDTVILKLDAFPYQKYGPIFGKINHISKGVLNPGQIYSSINIREPVYQTEILLEQQSITYDGEKFPLLPGMQLNADIITSERTLAEWLMAPFISAFKGSL